MGLHSFLVGAHGCDSARQARGYLEGHCVVAHCTEAESGKRLAPKRLIWRHTWVKCEQKYEH